MRPVSAVESPSSAGIQQNIKRCDRMNVKIEMNLYDYEKNIVKIKKNKNVFITYRKNKVFKVSRIMVVIYYNIKKVRV